MKKTKWRTLSIFVALVLAVALILPACSGSKEPATTQPAQTQLSQTKPAQTQPTQTALQPRSGGVFIQMMTGSLTNLGYTPTMPGHMIPFAFGCLEGFVQHNGRTGEFLPWLFTEWEEASDQSYIIFKLRQGVKYHDGTDFNAPGVKEYLDLKQEKSPGWLANVTSIEVIDDYTVKLNTDYFDIVMWAQLNEVHASPTQLAKGPEACMYYPVGTGPFKFVEYKRDQHLKYERFDDYWGGKPYLDRFEIIFLPDPAAQLAALLSGEGDHIRQIQFKDLDLLKSHGFQFADIPMIMCGMVPDSANPDSIFADVRVREAIDYAIDRETIARELGYGYVQPLDSIYPSPCPGYVPGLGRTYDPAKARQLLADAGYPNGFETDFHVSQFAKMDIIVAVQHNLEKVGIKVHIKEVDMGQWTSMRTKGWEGLLYMQGIFQAPYEYNLNRAFGKAYHDYVSAERPAGFDDTLDKLMRTMDVEARFPMAREIQEMVRDTAMFIPLITASQIGAITPRLHDHGMFEVNLLTWLPEKAWLSEK